MMGKHEKPKGKHREPKMCPYTWSKRGTVHDHHFCCLKFRHTGNHVCGTWECNESTP